MNQQRLFRLLWLSIAAAVATTGWERLDALIAFAVAVTATPSA